MTIFVLLLKSLTSASDSKCKLYKSAATLHRSQITVASNVHCALDVQTAHAHAPLQSDKFHVGTQH